MTRKNWELIENNVEQICPVMNGPEGFCRTGEEHKKQKQNDDSGITIEETAELYRFHE